MRHLKNLVLLGYDTIAVCDPSRGRLSESSALGRFSEYTDLWGALQTEKPQIVFVCNPTHLHVPSASLALSFGAHVFIEKPLSGTLQGVDTLIRKASQKKKIVMVACNYRFHKGFKKLEACVRTHEFGIPLVAKAALGYYLPSARTGVHYKKTYAAGRKGGGVILDSGSHAVDYLTALFGKIKDGVALKSSLHSLGIQSEEAAALIFRHASGVLSSVTLDYVSRKPIHRIELVTDRGVLTLDVKKDVLTFEDGRTKRIVHRGDGDVNEMFLEEIKDFLTCVKGKRKPRQDIGMAKETLQTLLAVSK